MSGVSFLSPYEAEVIIEKQNSQTSVLTCLVAESHLKNVDLSEF